jgi:hypothetical protein
VVELGLGAGVVGNGAFGYYGEVGVEEGNVRVVGSDCVVDLARGKGAVHVVK